MECVIDDREHYVSNMIEAFTVRARVERIQVGDFAIMHAGRIYAVIERKTLKDYAASICDKRIENRDKMIALRAETGCRLYWLVEGTPPKSENAKVGRIPFKSIESSMIHMTVRDNIFILWSRDLASTVRVLSQLTETIYEYDVQPALQSSLVDAVGGDQMALLKKKREYSDYEYVLDMWQAIAGVGPSTADYLADTMTIAQFINGDYDPDAIKPSVMKLLSADCQIADLIAAAPGIGAKSATHIVDTVANIADLVDDNVDLYIANKRKLGKDRRTKLTVLLNFRKRNAAGHADTQPAE